MKLKQLLMPVLAILLEAALLLGASAALSGTAEKNDRADLDFLLANLLPGASSFEQEEYTGEDAAIRAVYKAENGYVIETATVGYVDEITMYVGVTNKGKVVGLVVDELHETFGLGSKALTDTDFLAQFLGTAGDAAVGENVDAISGATVTSKAVARCVNAAVAFVTGADSSSGATCWGG